MNAREATEVEEQLLLIYRFLEEDRLFKKFYGADLATKKDNQILNRLLTEENAEEILRNCIRELEEIKTGSKPSRGKFEEMIVSYDPSDSYRKYGMKGLGDIYKLDLKRIIQLL
ncbi:MAG: hypothetical protein Q8N08_01105 [Methanobacteriaceae archaeon]|nr:hypothetical protein [Methanobacteriaceae archaeon]